MAKTILIADDNAHIRQALCEAFARESDFKVCAEAQDGRDAIEKAQQLRPDLIILDLSMPVMNGLDAARVLKDRMPSVPIILFTLHAFPSIEAEARVAGADAVVSKAEDVSVLKQKARTILYGNAA